MKSVTFWQMDFWRPNKVVVRFESGEMGGTEKLTYALVFVMFSFIANDLMRLFPVVIGVNMWDILSSVAYGILLFVGALYLYSLHKQPSSFIEKVIIMSVATTFEVIFKLAIPVVVLYGVLTFYFIEGNEWEVTTTWVDLLLTIFVSLGALFIMRKYFISK